MSRTALLSAIVFALLVAALLSVKGELLILALPPLVYLLTGLVSLPPEPDLEIQRTIDPERANPNAPVTVRVTLHNRGADLNHVMVEDVLPDGVVLQSGRARQILTLRKDETFSFEYVVSASRGTYHFDGIRVEMGDALDVVRRTEFIPIPGQLFIIPNVYRLRHIVIRPQRTRVYAGDIPARVGGSGAEFFSVRNYQLGDPPRLINWRASARHEEVYSNEFQQERAADVGIVLDARKRSNLFAGNHSIFDHSVLAAAALADALLMQGNRVGMAIQGSMLYWTFPAYGKVQRERIMRNLMRAHPEENQAFAGLPRLSFGMFPAKSQIILVSPLITDPLVADDLEVLTYWRARGFQVMVVAPDPIRYERSLLSPGVDSDLAARVVYLERRVALRRLIHAGIRVIEWDVTKPFDQVVGPHLRRGHAVQFLEGVQ